MAGSLEIFKISRGGSTREFYWLLFEQMLSGSLNSKHLPVFFRCLIFKNHCTVDILWRLDFPKTGFLPLMSKTPSSEQQSQVLLSQFHRSPYCITFLFVSSFRIFLFVVLFSEGKDFIGNFNLFKWKNELILDNWNNQNDNPKVIKNIWGAKASSFDEISVNQQYMDDFIFFWLLSFDEKFQEFTVKRCSSCSYQKANADPANCDWRLLLWVAF